MISSIPGYGLNAIEAAFHSNHLIIHWIYNMCVTRTRSKCVRFRCHWDVIRLLQTSYNVGELQHTIQEELTQAIGERIARDAEDLLPHFKYYQIEWCGHRGSQARHTFKFCRLSADRSAPLDKLVAVSDTHYPPKPVSMMSRSFSVSHLR